MVVADPGITDLQSKNGKSSCKVPFEQRYSHLIHCAYVMTYMYGYTAYIRRGTHTRQMHRKYLITQLCNQDCVPNQAAWVCQTKLHECASILRGLFPRHATVTRSGNHLNSANLAFKHLKRVQFHTPSRRMLDQSATGFHTQDTQGHQMSTASMFNSICWNRSKAAYSVP